MNIYLSLLLTLAAGSGGGIFFALLKIPNGLRIGSFAGAAALSIFLNAAWMPSQTMLFIQIVAGALVGSTMEKEDLRRLPLVIKPTIIMLLSYIILTAAAGAFIHAASPVNWATALMCTVPGGLTDIPVIAAGMGADTPKLAVVHLARYVMGVAAYPPMIMAYDNFMNARAEKRRKKRPAETAAPENRAGENYADQNSPEPRVPEQSGGDLPGTTVPVPESGGFSAEPAAERGKKSRGRLLLAEFCTLALSSGAGILGGLTGIPAGPILFALLAVMVLKLKFDFAHISPLTKRLIIIISGCYIGSLISKEDAMNFAALLVPLLVTVFGFIVNSFITGKILSAVCGFSRKEGLLSTTPAGASDVALNSIEMGVENGDIIIIQIVRSIVALAFFPQFVNLLLIFLR